MTFLVFALKKFITVPTLSSIFEVKHMPTFFLLIVLFLIWFTYERRKTDKKDKQTTESFWEKERRAGYVPKQSIADVHFISFPDGLIPDPESFSDPELKEKALLFLELSKNEAADLSEYSNTDLKLKYGTGNFQRLSNADRNFTELVPVTGELCELLQKNGFEEEALGLYEAAYKNRLFSNSLTLGYAALLSERNDTEKLRGLINTVNACPSCSQSLSDKLSIILNNTLIK